MGKENGVGGEKEAAPAVYLAKALGMLQETMQRSFWKLTVCRGGEANVINARYARCKPTQ